ncbi:MAG: mobile mystery protein A [Rhodobacteraceae bacterium]|nr:mobile mystery protein A [Paracoccaceae bacterium]
MDSVKKTVRRQYSAIVNAAAQNLEGLQRPREGWISTMRSALGMTGSDLARRTKVTPAAIYEVEQKEQSGAVTIQRMEKLAKAMGGRFVYAIVPQSGTVEEIIHSQAHQKAERLLHRTNTHMALEKQALEKTHIQEEINRLADDLFRNRPADFWSD